MALITIPTGLNLVAWTGPATTLSSAPWFTTTNLNGVYKPAVNRLGFISNKPGAAFPSFTQITPAPSGGIPLCYIFNVKTAFQLDDSLLGLVAPATPNTIPTASASNPATITLPTNQVALQGTGTDSDGTVVAYAWRQVTGPNTATGLPATTQNVLASNLIAGTYLFGFKTQDDDGAFSNEVFVNATVNAAASTVLAAPTLSAPTAVSFDSFTQGWSQIANNSGYDVQYSTSSGFPDTSATTTLQVSTNAVSRVIGGLAATTEYYVRVRARGTGSFANSPYSASVSATTLAVPAGTITLSAPTGSVAQEGQRALRATGTTVSSATGYRLFRSATVDGTYTQTGGTLGSVSYLDTNLLDDTLYFYKWQAVGNGSNIQDSTLASATPFSGRTAVGLPAHEAPFNATVDDNANLFGWTINPLGVPLSEYEISINDAAPFQATSNPQNIGNIDAPRGKVGVRRKASGSNSASAYLYNQQNFTYLFPAPAMADVGGWAAASNPGKLLFYEAVDTPITTTLSVEAVAGAQDITVSSASAIVADDIIWLGASRYAVLQVNGATVSLSTPVATTLVAGSPVRLARPSGISNSKIPNEGGNTLVVASNALTNKAKYLHADALFAIETTMQTSSFLISSLLLDGTGLNTVFMVAELLPGSGQGYLLKTNRPGTPGIIYDFVPNALQTFGLPSQHTLATSPVGRFVIALVRGATTTDVYYGTQADGSVTLQTRLPNNGWEFQSIIGLGDPALKMRLFELATYPSVALSSAQTGEWLTYLSNRYLDSANDGRAGL